MLGIFYQESQRTNTDRITRSC